MRQSNVKDALLFKMKIDEDPFGIEYVRIRSYIYCR